MIGLPIGILLLEPDGPDASAVHANSLLSACNAINFVGSAEYPHRVYILSLPTIGRNFPTRLAECPQFPPVPRSDQVGLPPSEANAAKTFRVLAKTPESKF